VFVFSFLILFHLEGGEPVRWKAEARLRQKKLLLFGHSEERQISLVKVARSTPPVNKSSKDPEPTTHSSRKRKTDPMPSDDVLLIDAGGDDYFDDQQPAASTSRRAVFGPDTPPTTPHKPDLSTDWQKETVKAQLRLSKSKRDGNSSPKKSRSSSRRSEGSSERRQRPDPYVKLTKLDDQALLATQKPRSRGDRGFVGHGAIMDRAIKIC
jgi:hypothetical protein